MNLNESNKRRAGGGSSEKWVGGERHENLKLAPKDANKLTQIVISDPKVRILNFHRKRCQGNRELFNDFKRCTEIEKYLQEPLSTFKGASPTPSEMGCT